MATEEHIPVAIFLWINQRFASGTLKVDVFA
jgi:hypothetical protein